MESIKKANAMARVPVWAWGILVLIVILWFLSPKIVGYWSGVGSPDRIGEFGDMFGSINTLFSGVAMWGVIIAIYLQRKELHQNTVEMQRSADGISKQVMISSMTALLNAIPSLEEQHNRRLRFLCGDTYDHGQDGYLNDLLSGLSAIEADLVVKTWWIKTDLDYNNRIGAAHQASDAEDENSVYRTSASTTASDLRKELRENEKKYKELRYTIARLSELEKRREKLLGELANLIEYEERPGE